MSSPPFGNPRDQQAREQLDEHGRPLRCVALLAVHGEGRAPLEDEVELLVTGPVLVVLADEILARGLRPGVGAEALGAEGAPEGRPAVVAGDLTQQVTTGTPIGVLKAISESGRQRASGLSLPSFAASSRGNSAGRSSTCSSATRLRMLSVRSVSPNGIVSVTRRPCTPSSPGMMTSAPTPSIFGSMFGLALTISSTVTPNLTAME